MLFFMQKSVDVPDEPGVTRRLKSAVHHMTLIAVLICYAMVGAALFHFIEYQSQLIRQSHRMKEVAAKLNTVSESFAQIAVNCSVEEQRVNGTADRCFDVFKTALLDEFPDAWRVKELYEWDFWHSIFYSATVFTTIGYGFMSCHTVLGRVVTILYAVLGIPLCLAVLNDIGTLLYRGFNYLYYVCRRITIRTARALLPIKSLHRLASQAQFHDDDVIPSMPVWLALCIILFYILVTARLFIIWEEWDYFEACYFVFVSLSTIGFGDVIPDHPKFMIAAFVFLLVGLSLVSMFISVLQDRLVRLYHKATTNLKKRGKTVPSLDSVLAATQEESTLTKQKESTASAETECTAISEQVGQSLP